MTVITGRGTAESHWQQWLTTADLPDAMAPVVAAGSTPRALVLAAHPDDEVLASGGLLQRLTRSGWTVGVIWASDGEASHPRSRVAVPAELARRRRQESLAARQDLGLQGSTTWLALPDSGLVDHEASLLDAVGAGATDADLLLAPWHGDGHPDHEVCGRVMRRLGRALARPVWELPIWAWHWGSPDALAARWPHARVVRLDARDRDVKATAIDRFDTQLRPLGDGPSEDAVLPPWVLARFARDVEVVLVTEAGDGAEAEAGDGHP